ncbi:MAG: hypothetical protein L7F78_19990, partial [Syntrophales bacterium LBB04]|nr:hypothetical protein [Syntrophales bacterium LBB04]
MKNQPRSVFFIMLIGGMLVFQLFGAYTWAADEPTTSTEVKDRAQIPDKDKWDLTSMYKTDADWEADAVALEAMLPKFEAFKGKIGKSPKALLEYFQLFEEASKKLDNFGSYAHMAYDQDTRDQKYSGYKERFSTVAQKFGEVNSWFSPELVAIKDATFARWYQENPKLHDYKQFIDNTLRTRKHTL